MLKPTICLIGCFMAFHVPCHSFQSISMPWKTTTTSPAQKALFSTIEPRGKGKRGRGSVNDGESELERTRAALEALLNMNGPLHEEHEALHILTSAGRHRRELEMELLRQLFEDDASPRSQETEGGGDINGKAVDELMNLWIYEHDVESAIQLEAMQDSCSPGMVKEEAQLRQMCEKFPLWAEPRARLSILLFMRGISAEAYECALSALELKPWHFEVYPVLIMISLRHQDVGRALYWARQALPNYRPTEGNRRRRKAWVDRALDNAARQWEEAERETQQHLGESLKFFTNGTLPSLDESNEAWQ
mmetsp:Transcript_3358/g.7016  ORF Transcript_3358/g.7016 Transcript_3358/m.7016 type:complete len:305 (-) Transcript_3358:387-1301(-)